MSADINLNFDTSTGTLHAGTLTATLIPYSGEFSCTGKDSRWHNDHGVWEMETKATAHGIALRLTGKLKTPVPGLTFGWRAKETLFLTHALSLGPRMGRCKSLLLSGEAGRELRSTSATMLTRQDEHIFFAAPLRNPAWSVFIGTTTRNGMDDFHLECTIAADGDTVADTGWIEISLAADPFETMRQWARENASVKKDFSRPLSAGWNTWDYYRWTISEKEVLKNAEFIAADPVLSRYVKRIIVDDGWQYCYGEWDANPLFPNGMKFLAEKLSALGFEPGLWFAPTLVEPHSPLAQLRGDLMAMSVGGQPCLAAGTGGRRCFILDPTLPEVQQHLRETFDRYVQMGYKYFKLDFMAATLAAPKFHDTSVSRTEIPRLIVKAVHEGVAGRAHILGCNYYYCGGNEFVDSARICTDIHARWESITLNAVSAAAQFYQNGILWHADPDFALARCPETSDDPDLHKLNPTWPGIAPDSPFNPRSANYSLADATLSEVETWLSLVLVSGGVINLSDDLTKLNERGVAMLRRLVSAPRGSNGFALDLFRSEIPGLWRQDLPGGRRRVLAVNWSEEPREIDISPALANGKWRTAENFWSGEKLDPAALKRPVELLPHHSLLLEIAE